MTRQEERPEEAMKRREQEAWTRGVNKRHKKRETRNKRETRKQRETETHKEA